MAPEKGSIIAPGCSFDLTASSKWGCANSQPMLQLAGTTTAGQECRFSLTTWGSRSPDRLVLCMQTQTLQTKDHAKGLRSRPETRGQTAACRALTGCLTT